VQEFLRIIEVLLSKYEAGLYFLGQHWFLPCYSTIDPILTLVKVREAQKSPNVALQFFTIFWIIYLNLETILVGWPVHWSHKGLGIAL